MDERYARNIGPLTEEECARLLKKTVFVAGCGGLGGHILDILLRVGVGEIRCADGDVFERSNLNRQLLSSEPVLGQGKAYTAAEHAAAVNPSVRFRYYESFLTEENAMTMIRGVDAVLDALDSAAARKTLKTACDSLKIPMFYGAVQGWIAQCALSLPGDGLVDILYPPDAREPSKGILAFTPACCAAFQTSLCVSYLCGREVQAGTLYYMDLSDMDFQTISLL